MNITPQSKLRFLNVPLEKDNKNQLIFSDLSSQTNYFLSKIIHIISDSYTYIRQDGSVKISKPIDELYNCNYFMYQNSGFTNKWFYAYIDKIEYIDEKTSKVFFTTDSFQTWYFDIEIKKSFVVREHVNNDTIGINTIPEGLETGEYIQQEDSSYYGLNDGCVCIASTWNPYTQSITGSSYYNNLFSGITYFVFPDPSVVSNTYYDSASKFIESVTGQGKLEAIQSVFIVPKKLINYDSISWLPVETGGLVYHRYAILPYSFDVKTLDELNVTKNYSNINGYTPKNNKLFCFPYNLLQIDNNNGTVANYNYENFSDETAKFTTKGVVSIGCSIKMIPKNYKNISENNNESINAGKFPVCNWFSDSYTNWLTQNSININGMNIPTGIASGAVQIVGQGLATGTISPSGVGAIGGSLMSIYQHSFMSPQTAGNLNVGDVTYSDNKNDFIIYKKCIKQEYAKIIDDYFTMFGYKVNKLKIPNIKGRYNWNYVQTIDVNIVGDIPQDDLQLIKNMFNNGITFWHNQNTFLDYSQNNNIV